jgi:hypothetical protein
MSKRNKVNYYAIIPNQEQSCKRGVFVCHENCLVHVFSMMMRMITVLLGYLLVAYAFHSGFKQEQRNTERRFKFGSVKSVLLSYHKPGLNYETV